MKSKIELKINASQNKLRNPKLSSTLCLKKKLFQIKEPTTNKDVCLSGEIK